MLPSAAQHNEVTFFRLSNMRQNSFRKFEPVLYLEMRKIGQSPQKHPPGIFPTGEMSPLAASAWGTV